MRIEYQGSLAGAHLFAVLLARNGVDAEFDVPHTLAGGNDGVVRVVANVGQGLLDAVDAIVIRGRIDRCTRHLRDDHVNAQVRVIDSDASGGSDPLP